MSASARYSFNTRIRLGIVGGAYILFWMLGILVIVSAQFIPIGLFVIAVLSQWYVFAQIARRLELKRYVPLFPLWSLLYSIFLIFQGLAFLKPGQKNEWS